MDQHDENYDAFVPIKLVDDLIQKRDISFIHWMDLMHHVFQFRVVQWLFKWFDHVGLF